MNPFRLPLFMISALAISGCLRAVDAQPITLGQTVRAKLPGNPDSVATLPKKLVERCLRWGGPYFQVYHVTVEKGCRYTTTLWFPPDKTQRRLMLLGENPFTDYTASYGRTDGVTRVSFLEGYNPHSWKCERLVQRQNFSVSSDSQHTTLYLVALSQKPGDVFEFQIKTPADPDPEVSSPGPMPGCSDYGKSQTWGQVMRNPLLLTLDPSEKPAAQAPSPVAQTGGLPLNEWVKICLPTTPADAATPKKLQDNHLKWIGPYGKVLHWNVQKGAHYTAYMRHAADRKNRRLTLAGDNPLTDYTWSYGVFGPRFNRNISLSYGLGPSYACSTLTSRANFAISDESQHTKAWAVIHSEIPGDCIEIMLRYPADPDSRVAGTDPMPDCPDYPKGHTWGKVWTTPLLLTFDPSEKKPN